MARNDFSSLTDFVTHLARIAASAHIAEHHALDGAARLVQKDAKRRIGHYQESVGPFPEWAELADATEDEKSRLGYPTGAPLLRTGELRESIEREVEGNEAVIGSKMDVAAYQEFGTEKIPPRPFIGPAAFNNKEKIERILGTAIVEGLFGGERIHEALGYDMELGGD